MENLITAYESLDLNNVRTYVQSGNVFFDSSNSNTSKLSSIIEKRIKRVFGFDVAVLIRTRNELQKIIEKNPFVNQKGVESSELYVIFLSRAPAETDLKQMKDIQSEPDAFDVSGKEIYLFCPHGYGKTKLSNNFFEKKLNVPATTRNWKTVTMLFSLAKNTAAVD